MEEEKKVIEPEEGLTWSPAASKWQSPHHPHIPSIHSPHLCRLEPDVHGKNKTRARRERTSYAKELQSMSFASLAESRLNRSSCPLEILFGIELDGDEKREHRGRRVDDPISCTKSPSPHLLHIHSSRLFLLSLLPGSNRTVTRKKRIDRTSDKVSNTKAIDKRKQTTASQV